MLTAGLVLAAVALMSIFQYSIGDAAGAGAYIFKAVAFNTLLEMLGDLDACPHSQLPNFQYSIGDAQMQRIRTSGRPG